MKTILASLLLPVAVAALSASQARSQPGGPPARPGLSITATPPSFGSALQAGGQVSWVVEVKYPPSSPERFKQDAARRPSLVITQPLTNLGTPQVSCDPSDACRAVRTQVDGQTVVTTLLPVPAGADVNISAKASIAAAGDFRVAVSRAINYPGRPGEPVSVATLVGTATDAAPPTNATNATNTADNNATNAPANSAANTVDNSVSNQADISNEVGPEPNDGRAWWPWILGAFGAAVAAVATAAWINHAQRLKWNRLIAVQARVDRSQSVTSAGPIPEAAPLVRIALHIEDGAAGPRGRIQVKRIA